MPRDPRLYMTFPIDFDEHPKVEPLSDAAFRTFVAMNGYSRRQRLDGRIPAIVVRKRWRARPISELLQSHPERPLLLLDGDVYVLREYAEHQFTTADEAELHDRKAAAGSKGGKAKAAAVAGAKQQPLQDVAGSGIEKEIDRQTDPTNDSEVSPEVPARADLTEWEFLVESASKLGIRKLERVLAAFDPIVGHIPADAAVDLARAILDLSTEHVRSPEAYLERTARNSPDTVLAEWKRVDAARPRFSIAEVA